MVCRDDIGKEYGIPATSAIFTAVPSQVLGERAGFNTVLTIPYTEILRKDGTTFFPNIQSSNLKVMIKKLS